MKKMVFLAVVFCFAACGRSTNAHSEVPQALGVGIPRVTNNPIEGMMAINESEYCGATFVWDYLDQWVDVENLNDRKVILKYQGYGMPEWVLLFLDPKGSEHSKKRIAHRIARGESVRVSMMDCALPYQTFILGKN